MALFNKRKVQSNGRFKKPNSFSHLYIYSIDEKNLPDIFRIFDLPDNIFPRYGRGHINGSLNFILKNSGLFWSGHYHL